MVAMRIDEMVVRQSRYPFLYLDGGCEREERPTEEERGVKRDIR